MIRAFQYLPAIAVVALLGCKRSPSDSQKIVCLPCIQPRSTAITQASQSQNGPTTQSETPIRYDSYEAALITAVCSVADGTDPIDEGGLDHLKAILDKHPNLVNRHRVLSPQRKPFGNEDWSPLSLAAASGNQPAAALLLERGADVNCTDSLGWTPLHRAARMGHLSVVQFLIEHGANIHAKTQARPQMTSNDFPNAPPPTLHAGPPIILPAMPAQTALDLAREWKHADVVEYLQSISK
ncbi:MAG TPA: ankyrin repeat domain-containing protein [Tepidisphaeraceae bacterium]|jgi:hypothetical protein|nr:ankyrin repeat domain-containing protein [Tepidisphaeraceae bacterium]